MATDYDLGFDDEEEEDYGTTPHSASPTPVEHLPPPTEIHGMSSYSDIHGSSAATVVGRPVSPRLFTAAAGHPTVTQLRVWKIENGNPVGIGAIEANASEEDLVRMFYSSMPKPGEGKAVFKLRPMDQDGNEMGVEATVVIGEHHRTLEQVRGSRAAASAPAYPPPGYGGGGIPSEVLNLMTRSIDQTRASLDEERTRSRDLMHQMAQERVDLASSAASSVAVMSERLLESERIAREAAMRAEQERNQQVNDSMSAFFSTQLNILKSDAERQAEMAARAQEQERERYAREREEAEMRRERDREDAENRRIRDREEAERRLLELKAEAAERERQRERELERRREEADRRREDEERRYQRQREEERAEATRREEERKREHALKLRQLEIEAEQRREHDRAMAAIQQAQLAATLASQKPAQGVKDVIKEATGLLKMVGVEPAELVQRFLNPPAAEPGTNQWADLVGKTMSTVGEVAKAKVQADAERSRAVQEERGAPVFVPVPAQIPPPGMPQPMWTGAPGQAAQPAQPQPVSAGMPPEPMPLPPGAQSAPGAAPIAPPPQVLPGAEKLPLRAQRLARKAIRDLVRKAAKAEPAKWEGLIAAAITSEPAIYHYVNAVTVYAALTETQAHPELIKALIAALKASPLVPDDLNYGGPA